ncbi:MAG: hypothetical protein A2Y40_05730 [Candidatus Margulisbacteria bacterium GWF2_35_9]|nr:MAG: hypothetical protein A2Y40_05730 [Candidatus Margulisbacteria bacterium GWF2_35_9]
MKKIIVLLCLGLLLSGYKFSLGGSKVLLKVGDSKLTMEELDQRIEAMPPQYKEYYSTPEGKKILIDNMKKEFLILGMAEKAAYDKNEEVLEQTEKQKKQIMVMIYLKDKIEKESEVKEKDVKDYYKDNKEEFKSKDQVKARHILVKTEQEAKDLIVKLNSGQDFGMLAKDYSIDPSGKANNGDLGWFAKGQMVKPFETAAFELEKGKYSKTPVQTQYGWHIILVEDKKESKDMTFEEVKADIETFLLQQKQKELLDKLLAEAETQIKVEDHSEQLLIKQ